jgi:hypothetical protein
MVAEAGLSIPSRLPAPPLFVDPSYRTTLFRVPLVTFDQAAFTVFAVPAADLGQPIPVLLFLADFPCLLNAESRYVGVVIVDAPTGDEYDLARYEPSELAENVGGNVAPWNLLFAGAIVPAGGADLGQPIRGTTLTNALPEVTGYPIEITPEDQSLADTDQTAIAPELRLRAYSQGAVLDGRGTAELAEYDGAGTVSPVTAAAYPDRGAVILEETAYTAAMRAAGNVVTVAAGVFQIVGLFQQNPAG